MLANTLLLTLATLAQAPAPQSFPAHRLYVASVGNDSVIEIDGAGDISREVLPGTLLDARNLAFEPHGDLYVVAGGTVQRITPSGDVAAVFDTGVGLALPRGIALGPGGNLFVTATDRVLELAADGSKVREIGGDLSIPSPAGLAIGADGTLYVAAAGGGSVYEFDSAGALIRILTPPGLDVPIGLAASPRGQLFVSSFFNGKVLALAPGGDVEMVYESPELVFPSGLAIGPNGNLFVASLLGNRIVEFDAAGTVVRTIELPAGTFPEGLSFAPKRFKTRLQGRLAPSTGKPKNLDEIVTLAIAPGSPTLAIGLEDGPLAQAFGTRAMVFHGYDPAVGELMKKRLVQGVQIASPHLGTGAATLHLEVLGSPIPFGAGQAYDPQSASGEVQRASAAGILRATLVTKKALD
jgi:DNA-binding beta-propeller fold protein YncE